MISKKRIILLSSILAGWAGLALAARPSPRGPAAVDVFLGTGDRINLFPGPSRPFGMVQLSPDTESHGYGYHYQQPQIQGFSLNHMSGPGCANEGDVFFSPTTGPVRTQVEDFESPYSHNRESAQPGFYQVQLRRWGIQVELTDTDRSGVARLTYPAGQPANFLIPISHTLNYTRAAQVRILNSSEIAGFVEDRAFCGRNKPFYRVYFFMRFSRPFASVGVWQGSRGQSAKVLPGVRQVAQTRHDAWDGAYVRWPAARHPRTVTVKIGISYVDQAGARNNLNVEARGKRFAALRRAAYRQWNRALHVIQVSGGTVADRRIFYTALYHTLLMPSLFSDADGRYRGFDDQVHRTAPGHPVYANYSGWDIYRSQIPLLALIAPKQLADMSQSIVLMYQQGGWIDRWPQINRYTNVMAGSPLTTAMATAWLDGIHGFDMKSAWPGMVKDATQAPPPHRPYQGEAGIRWIHRLHYVPDDKIRYGSVSQLQEDAIAYGSLYRLALVLDHPHAARQFYRRALYVRNLFDSQDHMFRPRLSNGQWRPNFNPAQPGHGFIEGSGWQYQWFDPEDMAWLIGAVGRQRFNRRLDAFFAQTDIQRHGRYYNPGNETDLEAPYEYDFSGQPWKTQALVRRVLSQNFRDAPDGSPGNDDCGEMASWAVFSMMGFYSVDPASLAYELTSPVFSKIVIHLHAPYPGKTFTIQASPNPGSHGYIQSARLNGKASSRDWINVHAITRGGRLQFVLSAMPNRSWGAAAADAPPSLSQRQP